jgi:hypothetical protein
VPQAWIDVARHLGNQRVAAAAGFVLSLPDKGFCKPIRAQPEPMFPKWTGDTGAKSPAAAPAY